MTTFNNINPSSSLVCVEFEPRPEGNLAFFHLKRGTDTAELKQWLSSANVGEELVAETQLEKHPVLIVRGAKSQNEILGVLATRDEQFRPAPFKHGVDIWGLRGNFSNAGQALQLLSSFMGKGFDGATFTFAVSSIAANTINILFGAEKSKDVHHLRALKEEFNKKFSEYMPQGATLHAPDEQRAELRKEPEKPKSAGEKFKDYMRRNSVRIGEIGLRYFGSIALVFPIKNWKLGWQEFTSAQGTLKSAIRQASNLETESKLAKGINGDKATLWVGVTYLIGKTIALFSKVPDRAYDPKPHTWLDTVREKYLFKLSSLIEAGAAGTLAYDRFVNRTILPSKLKMGKFQPFSAFGDKKLPDFLGGTGGAVFTAGLIIRYFAPFGSKVMNMEEINAHITDTLAQVPPEKLPQLIAESAATLVEHFKKAGKPMDFSKVYTQITTDLYRYHDVALPKQQLSPIDIASSPQWQANQEKRPESLAARIEKKEPLAAAAPPASLAAREDARPKDAGAVLGATA